MPVAHYDVGGKFPVHFVWQLPDGDFLRAIFEAEVLAIDRSLDRYRLRLNRLLAGRQETPTGEMRPPEAMNRDYWQWAGRLVSRQIHLAYEAEDGRPLRLRLTTLTGEHSFFFRL